MNCDIVATGTELLLGDSIDTNSVWIAEQLAALGINVHRRTVVGDNRERLADLLRHSLERVDAVIVTGGLGPTHDDITREAIADVMGVELEMDEDARKHIVKLFEDRRREMPLSNERQAMRPVGSTAIKQTRGTAPGLICPVDDKVIYAMPGPPSEMHDMAQNAVFPDLTARAGEPAVIVSRILRVWGLSEAALGEQLAGRIEALDEPDAGVTIALLAKAADGLWVRLTASGPDHLSAEHALAAEEREIRKILGNKIFGVDGQSMERVVGDMLMERGWTLSTAESMTGGLIASRITSTPGSSEWFRGSVVSYASEVKYDVLGVDRGPVVTEKSAAQMAAGARRVIGSDVAISVTGVAGPAEQEGVAVGTAYCGIAMPDGSVDTIELRLPGQRSQVTNLACINLLDALRLRLLGQA